MKVMGYGLWVRYLVRIPDAPQVRTVCAGCGLLFFAGEPHDYAACVSVRQWRERQILLDKLVSTQ